MKYKDKRKVGMVLLILGLIIFFINTVDYLGGFFGLSLGLKTVSSTTGIVFFVIGAGLAKKKK